MSFYLQLSRLTIRIMSTFVYVCLTREFLFCDSILYKVAFSSLCSHFICGLNGSLCGSYCYLYVFKYFSIICSNKWQMGALLWPSGDMQYIFDL